MPSVASETIALSSHYAALQNRRSSGLASEADTPFEMLLETGAPPPDHGPRRPEPSEPATQTRDSAPPPGDSKKTAASDSPDTRTGAKSSDNADDTPAAEAAPAEDVAAPGETPVVGEIVPEIPGAEETAKDSDPAATDVALADAEVEIAPPQPAVTPQAAVVPATAALDPTVAAGAEGEADPALTVTPAGQVSAPAAATAPDTSGTPELAPGIAAPVLPVVAKPGTSKDGKDTPDSKGKTELKAGDVTLETPDAPVESGKQPELPQQARTAPETRPPIQDEDASQQPVDGKSRADAVNAAEPAQQKPASVPAAQNFDTTNPALPTPTVAVPDAASLAVNNLRTPLMAATAVPVSGIAVEIAAQARAGNNRFEIRLDPPELGRIDVRLDVDREGNVKSRLVIERSDTYDLLRRDASTLERALQQAGLKTSDNAMEFSLRDQGNAQREARDQNQRNPERGIIPDADVLPAEAVSGYNRVLGLGSGVDIRI